MNRVTGYLRDAHIPYELKAHHPTESAAETARVLNIAPQRVLKTILLDTNRGHALVVILGSERLDMHLVREAVADPHAKLATEGELASDLPFFELGRIPPLGRAMNVPTFVDPKVMEQTDVVFCPGRRNFSVFVHTEDLFNSEEVTVAPLVELEDAETPLRLVGVSA